MLAARRFSAEPIHIMPELPPKILAACGEQSKTALLSKLNEAAPALDTPRWMPTNTHTTSSQHESCDFHNIQRAQTYRSLGREALRNSFSFVLDAVAAYTAHAASRSRKPATN
jgi:hypothetical protein